MNTILSVKLETATQGFESHYMEDLRSHDFYVEVTPQWLGSWSVKLDKSETGEFIATVTALGYQVQ